MFWIWSRKVDKQQFPHFYKAGRASKIEFILFLCLFPIGLFTADRDPDVRWICGSIEIILWIGILIYSLKRFWNTYSGVINLLPTKDTTLREKLVSCRIKYILCLIGIFMIVVVFAFALTLGRPSSYRVTEPMNLGGGRGTISYDVSTSGGSSAMMIVFQSLSLIFSWIIGWYFILKPFKEVQLRLSTLKS